MAVKDLITLEINFKLLTYKEICDFVNKISVYAFKTELKSVNKLELLVKIRWYCHLISWYIRTNKIKRTSDFSSKLNEDKVFSNEYKITLDVYLGIMEALTERFKSVDTTDIANFCDRVEVEMKL